MLDAGLLQEGYRQDTGVLGTELQSPSLETIEELTACIREYDRKLAALAKELYPETKLLERVQGVGALTALAFVLILEDPKRFVNGRAVEAYAGLVPGKDQSGDNDPQQRISRHGNELLRRLLVGCAHYILGPFGQDSDLRACFAELRVDEEPVRSHA